jgi:beta-lactamase regulating signal transducer with metallopeptidase domain
MTAAFLQSADFQAFAQISATRILNCTEEGIGIALLAWILLRTLGRQNSGTRFAVWFSTLLGIAALPLIGHFSANSAEIAKSEISLPSSWAFYVFAAWLLIAVAGLVRIGVGFWRLRQLRRGCVRLEAAVLDPVLRKTLEEFESSRPVTVCVSDRLRVPTAIGFVKPLVVIPSWAMCELSPIELNTILLHELAHLRRWDDWTNLVQKVLGALLFFHPAVWWIEKKLALEREMACDDLVLAQTASPRAYAECLVSIAETVAEKSLLRRGLALAQAAIGRIQHMSLRIAQILDEKRPGATRVWRPAPMLLTGITLAGVMVFSGAPRLVSFDNGSADNGLAGSGTESAQIKIGSAKTESAKMMVPSSSQEDLMSRVQAHMVPAKFVVKPGPKIATSAVANTVAAGTGLDRARLDRTGLDSTELDKTIAANAKTKPGKSAAVPAKATQRRVNPPVLIRSSFSGEEAITPQTLIFIMQTGTYDAYGAVVWDLCVWRVTVIGQAHQGQMVSGIVVKSI